MSDDVSGKQPERVRQFAIRRATVDDAARLARLGSTLFAQTFGATNRPEDMAAYLSSAFGESQQARELADSNDMFWIAEAYDGDPIGYAQLKRSSATSVQRLERPSELARIYADRAWHGRGVGERLLQQCVATAKEIGSTDLWLGVFQNNARAVAFYEKHGFRIAGEQTFVLGSDPQRDWVMVRRLV